MTDSPRTVKSSRLPSGLQHPVCGTVSPLSPCLWDSVTLAPTASPGRAQLAQDPLGMEGFESNPQGVPWR